MSDFADITFSFFKKEPIYVISKIFGFSNNLYSDPSFNIAMLDLPFYKLKDLNKDDKKKLIDEIQQLILKYSEKKLDDNNYETY